MFLNTVMRYAEILSESARANLYHATGASSHSRGEVADSRTSFSPPFGTSGSTIFKFRALESDGLGGFKSDRQDETHDFFRGGTKG